MNYSSLKLLQKHSQLTVILRGRAGYELIYITNEAVGRVGYYQLISGKSEKNNFLVNFQAILLISLGETSSNRDIFFTDDAAKKFFPTSKISAQEIRSSVFPYLVKVNDNCSYHGLREPIRKLENHYPELKVY